MLNVSFNEIICIGTKDFLGYFLSTICHFLGSCKNSIFLRILAPITWLLSRISTNKGGIQFLFFFNFTDQLLKLRTVFFNLIQTFNVTWIFSSFNSYLDYMIHLIFILKFFWVTFASHFASQRQKIRILRIEKKRNNVIIIFY